MSLSQAQLDLHWSNHKGWGGVVLANKWARIDGRLCSEAASAERSQWHGRVWAFADLLARRKHTAVGVEELRKGAYMLILGETKSLTQFNNDDLDRVLIVFRLLVEPDDLLAVNDFLAYEAFDAAKREIGRCKALGVPCGVALPEDPGERRRHLYYIRSCKPEYVRIILRDRFAGRMAEELSLAELRSLTTTLKNRPRAMVYNPAPAPKPKAEAVPAENIPF